MRSYKVDVEVFERMPVARAVLAQSIPAIVAQLIALLYNWADTFFLARLNKPELVAAATIVLPLYLMLTAIGNQPVRQSPGQARLYRGATRGIGHLLDGYDTGIGMLFVLSVV